MSSRVWGPLVGPFADSIRLSRGRIKNRVRDRYDAIATRYEKRWSRYVRASTRETLRRLTVRSRDRVLDVGCGNGLLLQRFKRRGWDVSGIDLSAWAEQAAERVGFLLYRGSIETASLPAGHFDVVTSTSTLEHIPNLVPHIQAVLRVLRPGGIAYFAGMPNYGSLAVRLGFSTFHHNRPPRHANWFTPRTLRLLLAHPNIQSNVSSLSVRTYGLPELHRFYAFALARLRRSGRRADRERGDTKQRNHDEGSTRKLLLKQLIHLNYYAGRPFGMGDKLEVAVTVRGPI